MKSYPIANPVKTDDPAGADKMILAAAQAGCRWLEGLLFQTGNVRVDLWNGPNGLGRVIEEAVKGAGVPNKRFLEIVTPRAICEQAGIVKKRRLVKK